MVYSIPPAAGQERYKSITTSYYRGAVAALICFDIGRRDTFTNVSMWWNELKQHTNASLLVLLVGNKSDRFERKVSTEEATDFARRHNFAYIETSALANKNVERAFESVIGDVHRVISRVKFGAGASSGGGARNQHTRATSGEAHELLMTGMAAPDDASMRAVAIGSGKSIEIPIDLSAAPEVSGTRMAILQSNCCGMS
jgi:hypothetical protein